MNSSGWILFAALGVLLLLFVYSLPTFIAFRRGHEYKWIIFAINVVLGASGLGWLIAFVWAIWPTTKSLADPVLGNPTGNGRNVGHTWGEIHASASAATQGNAAHQGPQQGLDALDRLGALAQKGVLTAEEFEKKKAEILAGI